MTAVGVSTAPAYTVYPPMTGNVACNYDGTSSFRPPLGFSPGHGDDNINPTVDSKWKVVGTLSACSGTQTGGNPRHPGPVATGDVLIKGKAVDHACQKVTDFGLSVSRVRIRWYEADGGHLLVSKGIGTATVEGLGDGWPYIGFGPMTEPGFVPPGIITVHLTAVLDAASRSFPGKTVTMTAVSDQTLEDTYLPCSFTYPPVTVGMAGWDFHGAQGASSLSVG